MATMMMAMVTATMTMTMMGNDDDNDGGGSRRATATAYSMVWGRHQAVGGGGNGNKVEMETMWVLMINRKFDLVKLLHGFIFNRTLQRSPFGIFLSGCDYPFRSLASKLPYVPMQELRGSSLDRDPEVGWGSSYLEPEKASDNSWLFPTFLNSYVW